MSDYCPVCCCTETLFPDQDGDEDESPSLRNWENWLKRRERICKNLSKSLERPPETLLLNYAEEYRKIQEERLKIEYANINTHFDKYRGNPEFWTLPYGLPQRCKGCNRKCDTVYFATKTKPQRNEIPSIDFVGIPDVILKQKHLIPRTRSIWNTWQKSSYRAERLSQLEPKIKKIISHIPETEQLAVEAQSIFRPVPDEIDEQPEVIPEKDPSTKSDLERTNVFEVNPVPRIAFEIRDILFSENIPFDTKTITLAFKLEGKDEADTHKSLRFTNKGRVVLRIYLKQFVGEDRIDKIMDKQKIPGFLFNNSEILLCPCSSHQLPIWFIPTEYGAYYDRWEIITVPKLPFGRIILELDGLLTIKDFQRKSQEIKDLLDHKVTVTRVKSILNSIIDWVATETSDGKVYTFTRRQLFESSNLEYRGVKRRLKYTYDEDVVHKLERFYHSIKEPEDPEAWDLSVDGLGPLARRKDIIDFARYQTEHLTSIRVLKGTKKSPEHQFIFGSNYKYFTILRDQLVTPLMVPFVDRERYLAAFFALRAHFLNMCTDLESYDDKKDYYPSYCFDEISNLDDLADRLVQEKFQDIWLDRLKRGLCEVNLTGTPKSFKLKNITPGDVRALYSAYSRVDQSMPKETKVSNVGGVNKVRISFENNQSLRRNENFNPLYDERFEYVESTINTRSSSTVTVKSIMPSVKIKPRDYYTTYVIIYTHLCSAVDGIVAAIETPTMMYDMLTLEEIHELVKCNVIKTETPLSSEQGSEDTEEKYEVDYDNDINEEAYKYATSLLVNPNIQNYLIEGHINDQVSDMYVSMEAMPLIGLSESEIEIKMMEDTKEVEPIHQECGIQTESDPLDQKKSTSIINYSDLPRSPSKEEGSSTKLLKSPHLSSQKLRTNEGSGPKVDSEFFYVQDYPGDQHNEG